MKIGLKWVHMARYELILRLDGALWLTSISGPLLTQKWPITFRKNPKKVLKSVPNQPSSLHENPNAPRDQIRRKGPAVFTLGWFGTDFKTFFGFFGFFIAPFWVRRGPEMIVSHRAPSSLNMSPYRAIWTHFRPNSMIFIDLILQTGKSCWHLGQAHDRFTTDSRQIHHRFTRDAS